tara:strand:- start:147 stop:566 length:420 start_codon:yes stop_codon:yes gene_type:complete
MKISWPICLIVLNISLCKDQGYGDEQIIIMLNQYYRNYSTVKLLGNHIFDNNNDIVFQIELETNLKDFNSSILDAFSVINKLSNLAKTNFTQAVVIFHFKSNKLPIIAKAKLDCSKKFFIKKTQNETQWRKNCLSIQTQ